MRRCGRLRLAGLGCEKGGSTTWGVTAGRISAEEEVAGEAVAAGMAAGMDAPGVAGGPLRVQRTAARRMPAPAAAQVAVRRARVRRLSTILTRFRGSGGRRASSKAVAIAAAEENRRHGSL